MKRSPNYLDDSSPMYNKLFDELQKNSNSFDRNNISNGEHTFYEFIDFLKSKAMYSEFIDWAKNQHESFASKVVNEFSGHEVFSNEDDVFK